MDLATNSPAPPGPRRSGTGAAVLLVSGLALATVALSVDLDRLLTILRFPTRELTNAWVRADLSILRGIGALVGIVMAISGVLLWRQPRFVARLADRTAALSSAVPPPVLIALSLAVLVLVKTVLQLGLSLFGYTAFGADDFTRALSSSYWLTFHRFDLGSEGWIGLSGSGWLPFPDYLFSLGLAVHNDLFLTPKVMNLLISGVGVIVVYLLGRELFGRAAGFIAAALFAFQPWQVWLGISGMTSDLPGVILIAVFGLYLARWLETGRPQSLLCAAVALGVANGFRYENWFFSLAFSALIVVMALAPATRGRLAKSWVALVCAVALVNAVPIVWMTASRLVLGSWLPAVHTNYAGMVIVGASDAEAKVVATASMAQMSMLLLAAGAYPFELTLAGAGVLWCLKSGSHRPLRLYLAVVLGAWLIFAIAFGGKLSASLVIARYLLSFVVLLLPYAGYFVAQLFEAPQRWRPQGLIAGLAILLVIASLDVARASNYPVNLPKDAVQAAWTVRGFQETGIIPANARILIERSQDWGDLAIVALASRPERFVALNRVGEVNQTDSTVGPLRSPAPAVLGGACEQSFESASCRATGVRERFDIVILSSASRIAGFENVFPVRSWTVGRYRIFDLRSAQLPTQAVESSQPGAKLARR